MPETPFSESPAVLSDESLARIIDNNSRGEGHLLVVANGFTARLAKQADSGQWNEIGRGDFGLRSGASVQALAQAGRLQWMEVDSSPSVVDISSATGSPATAEFVETWLKDAELLTGTAGRGDAPKKDELQYLGYLAGWRCQFAGCGKDLQRESLSGTPGNFSYFAHIIASSPKGPRGDKLLSGQQASSIENILLMCDECHRRIDRVDPNRFTVDILRTMRSTSIDEVRRLLDTLRYEEALPIVVMGNVTGQSPRFIQRDAEEAMWLRHLRMAPSGPEHYFFNGGHLHNPHAPHYWGSLFDALRDDIPLLRKRLNGTLRGDGTAMPLAIFPLHATSVLVLAGRVVGEGSRVIVFQPNRDRLADLPGGKWAFDEKAIPPAEGKYCLKELSSGGMGEDACLLVSLTFKIEPERLPDSLYREGAFQTGALELTLSDVMALRHDVISHPTDLDQFALVLEEAIRTMQDRWRVKRVHLFVGAPASACFRIGQKLQARHHAVYICYESGMGSGTTFVPTIAISNAKVEELQTGQSIALA